MSEIFSSFFSICGMLALKFHYSSRSKSWFIMVSILIFIRPFQKRRNTPSYFSVVPTLFDNDNVLCGDNDSNSDGDGFLRRQER